jgi:hypothetical protein
VASNGETWFLARVFQQADAFRLGTTRRDRSAVVITPALQPRPTYPDLPAPPELDLGLD